MRDITHEVAAISGYPREAILHDYWLIRGLYGISKHLPEDGYIRATPTRGQLARQIAPLDLPRVGRWAFAGGTSLTAAWGMCERFSDDLDACLFAHNAHTSKNALRVARKKVSVWATDEVGGTRRSIGAGTVRTSIIETSDGTRVAFDSVVSAPDPTHQFTKRITIRSIIGRYLPEAMFEMPETGGFVVPVVSPVMTGANKLNALHEHHARGDFNKLRSRVRDVYDLGLIAESGYADEIRNSVARIASESPRMVRPDGGYGLSSLYDSDDLGYQALLDAYYDDLPRILPYDAVLPDFGDTMNRIARMD